MARTNPSKEWRIPLGMAKPLELTLTRKTHKTSFYPIGRGLLYKMNGIIFQAGDPAYQPFFDITSPAAKKYAKTVGCDYKLLKMSSTPRIRDFITIGTGNKTRCTPKLIKI
jgi:hypothetical protein